MTLAEAAKPTNTKDMNTAPSTTELAAVPGSALGQWQGSPVDFRKWWDSKDHTFGGDATPLSVAGMAWEAAHQKYNPPPVNGDTECWVRERIITAIRMAVAVRKERQVRADDDLMESAIEGIANGAAVEVIHTLGLKPRYENLRLPRSRAGAASLPNDSSSATGGAQPASPP